jgi:methyl-accepting chemotaxis protein
MGVALVNRFSISQRSLLFIPLLLLTLAVVTWLGLSEVSNGLMEDRKEELKSLVQVASGVVDNWYQKEVSGQMTREQAQKGARDELWHLRFGNNTYFFIQGYDGITVLHIDRSLEGKNRISTTDPDGVPTVREQIQAAQGGGGFVYYRNPRSGGTSAGDGSAAIAKLSYTAPFAAWNWALGTGIYIDDVDVIFYRVVWTFALLAGATLLFGIGLCYVVGRSISRPLSLITERMGKLAGGDLSIDVPYLDDRHEIGHLAHALQVFKTSRQKMDELAAKQHTEQAAKLRRQETIERVIGEFQDRTTQVVDTVARAAQSVQSHAGSLAAMAQQSRTQVDVVNQAANDTTGNVQTIASAAEELSAAVNAVTQQVTRSTEVAERSVAEADRTSETMRGLSDASQKIGAIVQVIQDIASQTNLLALNATIEAARAGEAGKGFAVVASEVKALANQTTKATTEIQQQINGIQTETTRLAEAIAGIGKTVADMRVISTDIAAAMEQQGATTQEIARNINQAAGSTKEVSTNIAGVAKAADTTTRSVTELHEASEALLREATQLSTGMTNFFQEMRAA